MSEDALLSSRQAVAAELKRHLGEPPPRRVQVLTGPRQVGKTTLLLELASGRSPGGLRVGGRRGGRASGGVGPSSGFQPLVLCSRERGERAIAGVRFMFWGDFRLGKPSLDQLA